MQRSTPSRAPRRARRRTAPRTRARRRGFTLIEIVVCVAILAVLAGAAVPAAASYLNARARGATSAEMDLLASAIVEYFRDVRALPNALSRLETGTGIANWAGPYVTSSGTDKLSGLPSAQADGWGQAYTLTTASTSRITLTSRGADKTLATADDITLTIDVVPVRRELTLERLRTINQAVRSYNAQFLKSSPLSTTWSSAFNRLVATGYLPNDTSLLTDGWGSAFSAKPAALSPVVRYGSANVPGS